jgi:hypothetical protein
VAFDLDGSLTPFAVWDALEDDLGNAAQESTECFVSSHTERCLRERLRLVGESTTLLATQHSVQHRAEAALMESVAAHDALKAMSDADGGACRVRLDEDGTHVQIEVRNPSRHVLSDAWSMSVTMVRGVAMASDTDEGEDGARLTFGTAPRRSCVGPRPLLN